MRYKMLFFAAIIGVTICRKYMFINGKISENSFHLKEWQEFEPKSLNCENLENIPIENCGKCME
jgi:hypothetical protein